MEDFIHVTQSYFCQCQEGHRGPLTISDLNQMALWLFLAISLLAILLTQAERHL